MRYTIEKDRIVVEDATDFDPESTLTCGQVFRYGRDKDIWWVIAGDNFAKIVPAGEKKYYIETKNLDFFVKYFDFEKNYAKIKVALSKYPILKEPIEYGSGIRLLRQDLFEVIVSFIISACNNIPRIQKILGNICMRFGTKHEWGYAFPTIEQLSLATFDDFAKMGCGYRSPYLVHTIRALQDTPILENLQKADTKVAKKMLKGLYGIGDKVADCILLFGLNRYDVFPVDTWIDKVYHEDFGGKERSRAKIADYFVNEFGDYSGYAQQYLFYHKRKA